MDGEAKFRVGGGGSSVTKTVFCMLPRKISQMFGKVVVSTLFWGKVEGGVASQLPGSAVPVNISVEEQIGVGRPFMHWKSPGATAVGIVEITCPGCSLCAGCGP